MEGHEDDQASAIKTPVKRRLTFGGCLTPEIANSRATPGSKQRKRKILEPQDTTGSARKRRHTLSFDSVDDNKVGELALTPIQRVMLAGKKTFSTTTPRRNYRLKKRETSVVPLDSKQQTIIQMMAQQAHTPDRQRGVAGVTELPDKSQDQKSEFGDDVDASRMIKSPESSL